MYNGKKTLDDIFDEATNKLAAEITKEVDQELIKKMIEMHIKSEVQDITNRGTTASDLNLDI